MLIPVVCFSCGQCMAHIYKKYLELCEKKDPEYALKALNVERLCCRRTLFCHHDTIKILNYNIPETFTAISKQDAESAYKYKYTNDYEQNKDPVRKYNNSMKELAINRAIALAKIKVLNVLDIACGKAPDTTRFNNTGIFEHYTGIDANIEDSTIDTIVEYYDSIIRSMKSFRIFSGNLLTSRIDEVLTEGQALMNFGDNPNKRFNLITCFFALHYFVQFGFDKFLNQIYNMLEVNNSAFVATIVNFDKVRYTQDSHSLYSITNVNNSSIQIGNTPVAIIEYIYNYPHGQIVNSPEFALELTSFVKALESIFKGYSIELIPFEQMTKKSRALWNKFKPNGLMLDTANKEMFNLYSVLIISKK